jgi:hypothetical protein
MTVSGRPEGDGQSENANRTIKAQLRAALLVSNSQEEEYQEGWDNLLPEVEIAINNQVNAT